MPTRPLPPELVTKLGKLLPMLASDQMGEVVATIEAIKRALIAAERDWHDLTATLTSKGKEHDPGFGGPAMDYSDPYFYQRRQYHNPPNQQVDEVNSVALEAAIHGILNSGIKLKRNADGFLHDLLAKSRRYKTVRFTPAQRKWFNDLTAQAQAPAPPEDTPF